MGNGISSIINTRGSSYPQDLYPPVSTEAAEVPICSSLGCLCFDAQLQKFNSKPLIPDRSHEHI